MCNHSVLFTNKISPNHILGNTSLAKLVAIITYAQSCEDHLVTLVKFRGPRNKVGVPVKHYFFLWSS